jgi:hypothetical protein
MSAQAVFEQLKSLAGDWLGHRPDGRPVGVRYRLSAAGSVLVETWDLGPGVEALTVYHMDGGALLVTHFCPQGNQPRLRMRPSVSAGRLDFAFQDAAGVEPGHWVQQAFWIELHSDGTFSRGETYAHGDETETEAITYERLAS